MDNETLRILYVQQLRDLYDAELQLIDALPRIADAVTDPVLRHDLLHQLNQTHDHAKRLEDIFATMRTDPEGQFSSSMKSLIQDEMDHATSHSCVVARDAGVVCAAHRIAQYEIAAYGMVRVYARHLGDVDTVRAVQTTLREDYKMDQELIKLTENMINAHSKSTVAV
jgi:ferritin-like metal-binding protein YciE